MSPLVLGNLLVAVCIVAAGWPSTLAALHRLPIELVAAEVRAGKLPNRADFDDLVRHLSLAETTSPAARQDLALTLLLNATRPDEGATERQAQLVRAVAEFREYLANAPGDSLAWAGLTDALVAQGRRAEALTALKMSMVTAPRSPNLLLWRCKVGLDLFYILDAEGRELLEQQFRLATERSADAVVKLAVERSAVPIARILLESSPEASAEFEMRLVQTRS